MCDNPTLSQKKTQKKKNWLFYCIILLFYCTCYNHSQDFSVLAFVRKGQWTSCYIICLTFFSCCPNQRHLCPSETSCKQSKFKCFNLKQKFLLFTAKSCLLMLSGKYVTLKSALITKNEHILPTENHKIFDFTLDNTQGFFRALLNHSMKVKHQIQHPACIFLLKFNNISTRKRWEICSKLTIKTPERRNGTVLVYFFVNFEHISYLVLVFLLLTLNK